MIELLVIIYIPHLFKKLNRDLVEVQAARKQQLLDKLCIFMNNMKYCMLQMKLQEKIRKQLDICWGFQKIEMENYDFVTLLSHCDYIFVTM